MKADGAVHDLSGNGSDFRRIVADSADAILVFDGDGVVQFANREAGTLFQRHPDELIGRSYGIALESGDQSEWRIAEDDGPPTIAEIRLGPTVWDGRPAIIGTLRDITERKRLENSLRTAIRDGERNNRVKAQLLANLGHEVRTALNAILGFTQFIQTEPHGPVGSEKYREYLGDIHDSGTYLVRLVNDLLDLSKAEAGKLELTEEEFSLAPIIRGAVRTIMPAAREARLSLVTDELDEMLIVRADQIKIRQVLLNLLSNAVKYTPTGGEVRIAAHVSGTGACVIDVSDTGIGMSPDYLSTAFAAYRRFDNSYTRKVQGTGLGLALTKRLVELHGGAIRIVSDLGAGTSVTVTLPSRRVIRSEAFQLKLAANG